MSCIKVRKAAKIRKLYNQKPHLPQDTTWESNKNTIYITNKSQYVSPFPAGDHNAAMNRRESMRNTKKHNWSTKDLPPWNGQYKYFTGGPKPILRRYPHPYIRCGPRHVGVWFAGKTPSLINFIISKNV